MQTEIADGSSVVIPRDHQRAIDVRGESSLRGGERGRVVGCFLIYSIIFILS